MCTIGTKYQIIRIFSNRKWKIVNQLETSVYIVIVHIFVCPTDLIVLARNINKFINKQSNYMFESINSCRKGDLDKFATKRTRDSYHKRKYYFSSKF